MSKLFVENDLQKIEGVGPVKLKNMVKVFLKLINNSNNE